MVPLEYLVPVDVADVEAESDHQSSASRLDVAYVVGRVKLRLVREVPASASSVGAPALGFCLIDNRKGLVTSRQLATELLAVVVHRCVPLLLNRLLVVLGKQGIVYQFIKRLHALGRRIWPLQSQLVQIGSICIEFFAYALDSSRFAVLLEYLRLLLLHGCILS